MQHPETVTVVHGDSFAIINKSDLTDNHELFVESSEATLEKPAKRAYTRKTQE